MLVKSFAAIRKDAGLYCGSRLRSGEVLAYVGLSQNLKDLKAVRVLSNPKGTTLDRVLVECLLSKTKCRPHRGYSILWTHTAPRKVICS